MFRILNGLMAALFAFGAVVQYNDPDPLIWIFIYLAPGVLCIVAAVRGSVPGWAAFGVGAIALLWGLAWSRGAGLNDYFHMFDYWEMESAAAEEARETSGLLIIAGWMAVLAGRAWFHKRGKYDLA